MKTRVLSGLIMLPLLIIVIIRGWVLFAGCFVLSLMALYEFFRGFKEMGIKPSYSIAAGSTVLLYLLGLLQGLYRTGHDGLAFSVSAEAVMLWIFVSMLACLLYLFSIEKRKLEDAMVTAVSIFYIVFFCYHIAALGMDPLWSLFVWLVIITAFGTDICAYFAGVLMGKHKLCPKISPKKTWEGAIGGIIGSVVLCGLFGFFFARPVLIHCIIIGVLGSIISMFGDLTASIFKRKMGIKDYGNLIPGHGGILDRFDSVLFTGPFVYYYVTIVFGFGTIAAW